MRRRSPPLSAQSVPAGIVVAVSLGSRRRSFKLAPRAMITVACAAVLVALCAAAYLALGADEAPDIAEQQAQIESAYEHKISALRLRVSQLATRETMGRSALAQKVELLQQRQAQLENRSDIVARLAESAGVTVVARAAPIGNSMQAAALATPQPENFDLRLSRADDPAPAEVARLPASDVALATRLDQLSQSIDRLDAAQRDGLAAVAQPARAAAARLKRAFDIAGLPAEKFVSRTAQKAAVGGPFIPADPAAVSAFAREAASAQDAITTLSRLRRGLAHAPLRKPLSGAAQLTSTFGYRTDPFLGRPALHSGVDLRDAYGASVRATAAGVVTAAGPQGGYGNMVELDHGGGLSTRYAHLSAIAVAPGEKVAPGAALGRVGSTGRSTGPHLHYEVRVDGEPVDPSRFLRAAVALESAQ